MEKRGYGGRGKAVESRHPSELLPLTSYIGIKVVSAKGKTRKKNNIRGLDDDDTCFPTALLCGGSGLHKLRVLPTRCYLPLIYEIYKCLAWLNKIYPSLAPNLVMWT